MTSDDDDQSVEAPDEHEDEDEQEDGNEGTADVDPFRIESRLTSHGIYVTDLVGTESAGYELTYESMAAEDGAVPHRELGRVINVFRDLYGEDWAGSDIEATVQDLDGDPVATWHCDREWLTALAEGDLTEVEFSRKVVATLEPVEE